MSRIARAPVVVNPVVVHPGERRLRLDGHWDFRLDPQDRGLAERWFEKPGLLVDQIDVPGTWQGQGFGGEGKDVLWDFQLAARVFRATYAGTGWYGKRFRAPADWRGLRTWVNFGGVHPTAEVWLNGVRLGENHAPFVPFGFEATDVLAFDAENLLVVRVHEQDRILALAYNWQGNWSGLYRGVDIAATGQAFLEYVGIHPDTDQERLRIKARVGGFQVPTVPLAIRVSVRSADNGAEAGAAETETAGDEVAIDVPLASPRPWSPEHPDLYRVDVALEQQGQVADALSARVGLLKLSTKGKQFLINGEPYFMRGTGDFVSSPETGSPDTDRERWRRKLSTLRSYGYNYVRCQSYVPTPEYFDAADELGVLVQSEMGILGAWGGNSVWHGYAWPVPSCELRDALKWQWDRVVMRDVNHPSAAIYCMGNENRPRSVYPRTAWQCYRETKTIKPSAFVIWTDGMYDPDMPGDFANDEAEVGAKCEKPLIQHEFRWWSSFPDVRTMGKYVGAVRPYSAEIAREAASRHGIDHVLPQAAAASQRLQYVEAKTKMEACRRDNPTIAGICHFNAMDANPSPQGIIDEFYDRKYVDANTWLQTSGDCVILADVGFDDRVVGPGETLKVALSVSDFSHPPLGKPTLSWKIVAAGSTLADGTIPYSHSPFRTCPAGSLEVEIPSVPRPVAARLHAELREADRVFRNWWDFWLLPLVTTLPPFVVVYDSPCYTWLKGLRGLRTVSPSDIAAADDVRVVLTERFDDTLIAFARRGGRVILAASEGIVRPFLPKLGAGAGHYFFTPPANYPPYEDGHDGAIIAPHPMLGELPHEGFADLQFFRMMASDSPPIDLEPLGLNDREPVIRVMHSYPVCRPLAYLIEGSIGKGGLIVSSLNLDQSLPEGRYLLSQICAYAAGDRLCRARELSPEAASRISAASLLP